MRWELQSWQVACPASSPAGQAQRVALARAVLLKPHVLLADEPTASLDDEAAAQAVGTAASGIPQPGTVPRW